MPSKSKKQHNLMAAAAHNPAFAKKVGVPVSVAQEYNKADKGKKFKEGGMMDKKDIKQDKAMAKKAVGMHEKQLHGGKKSDLAALKKGGKVKKMFGGGIAFPKGGLPTKPNSSGARSFGDSVGMPKATQEKVRAAMSRGTPKRLPNGVSRMGGIRMKKGGSCKGYAKGGGIEVRGKTKGKII